MCVIDVQGTETTGAPKRGPATPANASSAKPSQEAAQPAKDDMPPVPTASTASTPIKSPATKKYKSYVSPTKDTLMDHDHHEEEVEAPSFQIKAHLCVAIASCSATSLHAADDHGHTTKNI